MRNANALGFSGLAFCNDRLSRNLTAQEWERYLDPNLTTYRRTCPNFPAPSQLDITYQ